MGGQGAFVWGAYGVTALLFAVEVLLVLRCGVSTRRTLADAHPAAPGMRLQEQRGTQ
ncbi:heme exporter protein CcmD [Cupriavidus necator]|nr:heme exporter protein CcmD [Cupriavidus necator]QQB80692.1 heme exporter protein CcmD [Cupriavidus necator]